MRHYSYGISVTSAPLWLIAARFPDRNNITSVGGATPSPTGTCLFYFRSEGFATARRSVASNPAGLNCGRSVVEAEYLIPKYLSA